MESFISKISTKRHPQSGPEAKSRHVRVPDDWAEEILAEGYTHVTTSRSRYDERVLVLTPLRECDVKEYRRQRQAERRREASRRYYGRKVAARLGFGERA